MSELVEAAEVAEEVISDVAEVVALPNVKLIAGSALVAGLVVGGLVGFKVADKRLKTKYEKMADDEIADMQDHYWAKIKALKPKPDLAEAGDQAKAEMEVDKIVEERQYRPASPPVPVQPREPLPNSAGITAYRPEDRAAETRNVFDEEEFVWDYATEVKGRTETYPYVLHKDEYDQNENEWTQTTLTWYDDDDVIADERDGTVDNRLEIIGQEVLERFGHGSGDPHVVYVRNQAMEIEFEIVRMPGGNYQQHVHGIDPDDGGSELRHSASRFRRSRGWDDE